MKPTKIHGSKIRSALRSNLQYAGKVCDCTRVWCEDGSLHLVTGYDSRTLGEDPCFDTVVGYWTIPEGKSYLDKGCEEVITRPSFIEFIKPS